MIHPICQLSLQQLRGKPAVRIPSTCFADTYYFDQSGAKNYLYINQSVGKTIVLKGPSSDDAVIRGQFVVSGYTKDTASGALIFQDMKFNLSEGVDGFYVYNSVNGSILSLPNSSALPQNILIDKCEFVGYQDQTYALVARLQGNAGNSSWNVTMDNCLVTGGRGAVDAYANDLTVSNSVISSDSVSSYNMGVNFMGGSNLTVVNNTITAKSHAVRVGSNQVTGDTLIKNNTLKTLNQSTICNSTGAAISGAHGTIVLRDVLGKIVIEDNILLSVNAADAGDVKLINNLSKSLVDLVASKNYWDGTGGVLLHNLSLSAVSPYYASLNPDGTINKESLVTPLVSNTNVTGVTWTNDTNGWNLTLDKNASGTSAKMNHVRDCRAVHITVC